MLGAGSHGAGAACGGVGGAEGRRSSKAARVTRRVLDVGCGAGHEVRRLLELAPSCSVTALDSTELAQSALAKTSEALAALRALGVSTVDVTLPRRLPCADATFDVAYARLSLHYFTADELRTQILSELRRVLRPGGVLLVVIKTASGEAGEFTTACGDRKVHLSTSAWHALLQGAGLALMRSMAMMAGSSREAWRAAGAPWLFEASHAL